MTPFRLFPVLYVTSGLFAYIVAVGILYAELEGWTYIHGVYYAVISGTTVGYGDLTPERDITKLVSLGVLPFAVCFVGTKLGEIGESIFSGGSRGDLQKLLEVGAESVSLFFSSRFLASSCICFRRFKPYPYSFALLHSSPLCRAL